MRTRQVPFNHPYFAGSELSNINEAVLDHAHLSAGGVFSHRCEQWLTEHTGASGAFLTHSCTGALEMAALLAGIAPGDEVVMPSFTFVSTANAFVLRGAVPVFVDIRADTLNLDETLIEDAITERTRAIVPMHYAGVACEMDAILEIAERRGLLVIEDAAHALTATYRGRPLGTIGQVGTVSFHETKNVTSGEGGALLLRDPDLLRHAEMLHEKGTTRRAFLKGEAPQYEWVGVGSSFGLSEINAAFLHAQLMRAGDICRMRLDTWHRYHERLQPLAAAGRLRLPVVPRHCEHPGHLYYVLARDRGDRDDLIATLRKRGVQAVFHYVPLHSSPAGRRFGKVVGRIDRTEHASASLIRLPLWAGMEEADVEHVVDALCDAAL